MTNFREYVDPQTGELIEGRLITKEQQELIDSKRNEEQTRRDDNRRFIICYNDPIKSAADKLTLNDAGYLMRLLPYMKLHGDGELQANGKPLKVVEIQKILGRGKDATREILARLHDIGVIEKVDRVYYISKMYHHYGRGADTSQPFIKLMKAEAKEQLKKLTVSEAGLLLKAAPYFHFTRYVLCIDGNASEDNIKPLTQEQLAGALEHDSVTVCKLMQGLKKKKAIATLSTGRSIHTYVYPDLITRGVKSKHYETTKAMFNLAKK